MFPHSVPPASLINFPYSHGLQHQQKEEQLEFDRQQFELNRHKLGTLQDINYGIPREFYITGQPLPYEVKVELYNSSLWKKFNAETTEMIITKNGRRMFPSVEITVSGLDKQDNYCIILELALASDRRQKYVKSEESGEETDVKSFHNSAAKGWTPTSIAEPQPEHHRRMLVHPDSPACGDHWMKQKPISFSKVKITNDICTSQQNQILLTSMHKYQARIWIVKCDNLLNLREYYSHPSAFYTLKETEFIAVTAYQNENIINLKIANNPFAKGFRKDGQSRHKRKNLKENNIAGDCIAEEKDNSTETKDHLLEEEMNVMFLKANEQSQASMTDSSGTDSYELNNNREIPSLSSSLSNTTCTSTNNDRKTRPQFHRPWADNHEIEKSYVSLPLVNELTAVVPPSYYALYKNHSNYSHYFNSSLHSQYNFYS
ncbi:T-box-containing protein TBX6L-like [Polistes fuscatus]|uniref:T-box-containing protein TBX6L-like n=1 Tax=Polistes fuscatus TaxID=30207 RepID=UPI001CA7B941|nr:T-box-containing protein TBX6L-like [Polistes fuscatus]